jgi:hypothetical protein
MICMTGVKYMLTATLNATPNSYRDIIDNCLSLIEVKDSAFRQGL